MPPVIDLTRTARPAGLGVARCAQAAEAVPVAAGIAPAWRLNSGAEMITSIDGIANGAPMVLVIDLASVEFAAAEIKMMREHWIGPIGRWTNLVADLNGPKGPGLYGTPIFYASETETERELPLLREADEVAALLRRKHPWQASVEIGGALEQYELVAPGASVEVNGTTLIAESGPGAPPFYVLRGGLVTEASVCLDGADADTGPTLLASRHAAQSTIKDTPMDLKALLAKYAEKHHGAIARLHAGGKTADEIATAMLAADKKESDDELATLKADLAAARTALASAEAAAATKVKELQDQLDGLKPPGGEGGGDALPAGGDATSQHAAPKTVTAGMARLSAAGDKRSGFALRNAALAKWPGLRAGLPKA